VARTCHAARTGAGPAGHGAAHEYRPMDVAHYRRARGGRARTSGPLWGVRVMKMLRRALVALGLAGLVAGVLRLRGAGGVPPQRGGWRELNGPELR